MRGTSEQTDGTLPGGFVGRKNLAVEMSSSVISSKELRDRNGKVQVMMTPKMTEDMSDKLIESVILAFVKYTVASSAPTRLHWGLKDYGRSKLFPRSCSDYLECSENTGFSSTLACQVLKLGDRVHSISISCPRHNTSKTWATYTYDCGRNSEAHKEAHLSQRSLPQARSKV